MIPRHYLSVGDYAVIGASLIVPVLIGLKFRTSSGKHSTADEYFLAGRKANMLPVVMSASVSIMSAILMIGVPADSYRFGPAYIQQIFVLPLGQILAAFVFIPVYFRCGVSSVYELLEKRFGKCTRYSISALFIIQTVLYMCMVLLAPVLALNAITEFSMEMAIIVFGTVCAFYCVLGGMKAVLWTDVFQAGLMFTCIIVLYVIGISEVGSLEEITRRASAGRRLNFFDFSFDFETRYTFWNCFGRGLIYGASQWGANQLEVQRSLSMSECKRAQRSILWSTFPVFFLLISSNLLGILLYAVFYLCDPVLMVNETGISKYDQLVPYFIVSRLHLLPGLTGLCIAGIFSGSLSTMSSALNSLATVTVVDFIQPIFPRISDSRALFMGKGLGIFYSALFVLLTLCIGLTFALSKTDSILQSAVTFISLTEGPTLAVFLIGVLTRKTSDKSAMAGLLVGVSIVGWIGFGSLFGGYTPPSLPLETSGCPAYQNTTSDLLMNSTTLCSSISDCSLERSAKNDEVFALYKIPFTSMAPIGCIVTSISVFIASLILDGNKNVIPRDSNCLSPVVRYWMKDTPEQEIKGNRQEMKTDLRNVYSERTRL